MSQLSEMGINVVESEDDVEDSEREQEKEEDEDGEEGGSPARSKSTALGDHHQGSLRPHGRSRAHVPARDGLGRAAVARGRDRDRQAHRGRPRRDDRAACARAR